MTNLRVSSPISPSQKGAHIGIFGKDDITPTIPKNFYGNNHWKSQTGSFPVDEDLLTDMTEESEQMQDSAVYSLYEESTGSEQLSDCNNILPMDKTSDIPTIDLHESTNLHIDTDPKLANLINSLSDSKETNLLSTDDQASQSTNQFNDSANLHIRNTFRPTLESTNHRWPLTPGPEYNQFFDAMITNSVKQCEDLQRSLDEYISQISNKK